jgi:hypothetical protein
VNYDVAEVKHQPTVGRLTFRADAYLIFLFDSCGCGFGQGVQHTGAGAGTDNEVISKICNPMNIQQNNIFGFNFFQNRDD